MVVRGSQEHPGANAVEDESGRVVNLSQMSRLVSRFNISCCCMYSVLQSTPYMGITLMDNY